MQSINALSLAPNVHTWLSNSRHPRILHVFDHACNLINERREVLSIVTPQIGNGPFNLVIPRLRKSFERLSHGDSSRQTSEVFFNELNIESPISVHEDQLFLGDFAISTANAKLWNPRPDWKELHARRESLLHQVTQLRITDYPFSNSLVSSLPVALLKRDIAGANEITSRLAGLGAGLTPAGDDFMMGAIYAAWIIHPEEVARSFAEEIANVAAPLTTSLSAAWLRSAGQGEAGILWHDFFNALISLGSARIAESMDRILAVGETSGADALAGFIGSFLTWMEKAGIAHG